MYYLSEGLIVILTTIWYLQKLGRDWQEHTSCLENGYEKIQSQEVKSGGS
jgi:hypothetical protein